MAIFTILILPNHEHEMFLGSVCVLSYFLEQWFVVPLEEVLYLLCQLYSQVFFSLCSDCKWVFTHDLALCLSVVGAQDACDFCTLILYPETLPKLLISLRRFWTETMGSSKYTIISSGNSESLTSLVGCLSGYFILFCLFLQL